MAILYALGDALVTHEELAERSTEVRSFGEGMARGGAVSLDFSTGRAAAENVITATTATDATTDTEPRTPNPFTPVGLGKPLSIEIRHVYTGEYPHSGLFGGKKDLLVTSAVKGLVTYEAAPRAVNFLRDGVQRNTSFATPAATEQGTPLVFYSPALTQASTVASFEMVFDKFPNELFEQVGNALTGAAGIPVFASKSVFLLGAGSLSRLAGKVGDSLFDGTPDFSSTEAIVFERPGALDTVADFRLVTRNDVEASHLADHRVSATGALVHTATGKPYAGPHPYMVISLDGREVKNYENFAPTAASAALLDRFFGIREGKEQPADMLLDALKLYNDWKFRGKADVLQNDLKALDPNSDAYKKKKGEYDAFVKNILSEMLRPKSS